MENFEITSDFIRGHIDTIILKAILSGDKHAQEISNYIEEKSNGSYTVKQATLYSALKRLENAKLVKAYWHDAPEGGRRRYFNITEKGANTVQKQLSEYGFSRSIIDSLVDETPATNNQPVVQVITQQVTENTEKTTNVEEVKTVVTEEIVQNPLQTETLFKVTEAEPKKEEKISENSFDEVNYKSVLSGLFSVIPTEKSEKPADLTETLHSSTTPNTDTFVDLDELKSETIIKKQHSEIDFSDIIEQAEVEGYKIRISSKKQIKSVGNIFINKVNFVAILSVFLLVLLEVLTYSILFNKAKTTVNFIYYCIPVVFTAIFAFIFVAKYIKSPQKTISLYSNPLSTIVILGLNAVLMIFAFNVLSGTDFVSEMQLVTKVFLPILVVFDVVFFFLIKSILVKSNNFLSK